LGVEEQFYLIFPVFVWMLRRPRVKETWLMTISFVLVTISSFTLYLIVPIEAIASHYLLQYRAWELAAGSLAFLHKTSPREFVTKLPFISELGLVLIIFLTIGSITFDTRAIKLALVLLTVFLLVNLNERDLAYKALTFKPIVKVGLISYSLYLWHQPVLTLSKWTVGQHFWLVPIQLALIYAIASFSYKWIEQPIIFADSLKSAKKTFIFVIGSAFLAASIIFCLWRPLLTKLPIHSDLFLGSDNKEQLTDAPIDFYDSKSGKFAKNCHTSDRSIDALKGSWSLDEDFITNCLNGDQKNLIAFVGDSHTLSMFPIAIDIANSRKATTFILSRDGCAYPSQGSTSRSGCNEVMTNTSEFLLDKMRLNNSPDAIIATSRLLSHFAINGSHSGQFGNGSTAEAVRTNLSKYIQSLAALAANLRLSDDFLVVTAPLPYFPGLETELCEDQWFRPNALKTSTCFGTPRIELLRQREAIMSNLNELSAQNENVIVFDPFNLFCPESKVCKPKLKAEFNFSDADHLSAVGAKALTAPLIETLQLLGVVDNH
jgi:hypothetical protein